MAWKDIGDAAYSGTAAIGRMSSVIRLSVSIIAFIIFVTIGIMFLVSASKKESDDETKKRNTIIGWIFIALAIFMLPVSIITLVFLMKSKPAAAIVGTTDVLGGIARALRR
jgi:putative Mn2+ efflux pump MntP